MEMAIAEQLDWLKHHSQDVYNDIFALLQGDESKQHKAMASIEQRFLFINQGSAEDELVEQELVTRRPYYVAKCLTHFLELHKHEYFSLSMLVVFTKYASINHKSSTVKEVAAELLKAVSDKKAVIEGYLHHEDTAIRNLADEVLFGL
jgi:hypothetical protein